MGWWTGTDSMASKSPLTGDPFLWEGAFKMKPCKWPWSAPLGWPFALLDNLQANIGTLCHQTTAGIMLNISTKLPSFQADVKQPDLSWIVLIYVAFCLLIHVATPEQHLCSISTVKWQIKPWQWSTSFFSLHSFTESGPGFVKPTL